MSKGRHIGKKAGGAYVGKTFTKAYGAAELRAARALAEQGLAARDRRTGDLVEHICPDCGGGPLTNTQSGLILVETCGTCGGRGLISDEQARRMGA